MKIIGVTGGTGAGKSVLSTELMKLGAVVIDADRISRQVVMAGNAAFDEIVAAFGKGILGDDGELNRQKLGGVVFNDPGKLELLENITHKYIFKEMQSQLNNCNADVVVLDVPLLFQCDFPIRCDITVAVLAGPELRKERIMLRDNISEAAAEARMKRQLTNDGYRALADLCFENNGDINAVKEFAKVLYFDFKTEK